MAFTQTVAYSDSDAAIYVNNLRVALVRSITERVKTELHELKAIGEAQPVSITAGGKSFSDHSSNWECGGKCSGFSVSCSVVWKSCRAFFGREPCNLVQKELASDDRFLCVKHSPVFELFGFASMGWICAESVAALHTGLIGG